MARVSLIEPDHHPELEPVVADLEAVLGLAVAFRDPGVARFGLHNAVLPAGSQFVEVVSPTRMDTAGGRYLERRGGVRARRHASSCSTSSTTPDTRGAST